MPLCMTSLIVCRDITKKMKARKDVAVGNVNYSCLLVVFNGCPRTSHQQVLICFFPLTVEKRRCSCSR